MPLLPPKGKKKHIAFDIDPHGQIQESLSVEGGSQQCDQHISDKAARASLKKQLDQEGSVQVFQRRPLATFDLPVRDPDPCPLSGSAHDSLDIGFGVGVGSE